MSVDDLLDTGEHETLYNLRVADFHTYFVGCDEWGFAVWAHNAACTPEEASQLRKIANDPDTPFEARLSAIERVAEFEVAQQQARRELYTARFFQELSDNTGYATLSKTTQQWLLDPARTRSEIQGYLKQYLNNSETRAAAWRDKLIDMVASREKFAMQAEAHHLIPWDSKAHPHHTHPLLKQAGLGTPTALRDYAANLVDVVGHRNLPGEKGGHWDPYHAGVTQHLDAGLQRLAGAKGKSAALTEVNRILSELAQDVDTGALPLYKPPHIVYLLR